MGRNEAAQPIWVPRGTSPTLCPLPVPGCSASRTSPERHRCPRPGSPVPDTQTTCGPVPWYPRPPVPDLPVLPAEPLGRPKELRSPKVRDPAAGPRSRGRWSPGFCRRSLRCLGPPLITCSLPSGLHRPVRSLPREAGRWRAGPGRGPCPTTGREVGRWKGHTEGGWK